MSAMNWSVELPVRACMHKAALTWWCMRHCANTLRIQAGMKTPSSLRGDAPAPGYVPISVSLFQGGIFRPTHFACRRRCCLPACVRRAAQLTVHSTPDRRKSGTPR